MKPFTTKPSKKISGNKRVNFKHGKSNNRGITGKQNAVCKWRSRKGKRRADKIDIQKSLDN